MNALGRLAQRATDDPFFLGAALHRFAASEGLDDVALAGRLGCTAEVLAPLYLCRVPRAEAPSFGQDVDLIAARFQVNPEVLAEIVRRGQILQVLQREAEKEPTDAAGYVIAARDRPPPAPPSPEGEPP